MNMFGLGLVNSLIACAGYAFAIVVLVNLAKAIRFLWRGTRSPLHDLLGPLEGQFLSVEGDMHDYRDTYVGNTLHMHSAVFTNICFCFTQLHSAKRLRWFKEYGPVLAFRGFLGVRIYIYEFLIHNGF
jgi:hypothetical protein